jgi:hypothetical protein
VVVEGEVVVAVVVDLDVLGRRASRPFERIWYIRAFRPAW